MLKNYLQLQQLQLPFNFNLHVGDDIDPETVMVPTMLTQPFVENAVVHAMKDNQDGQIDISYERLGKLIQISIIDNGPGIKNRTKHSEQQLHRSMSSDIVTSRLAMLERTHGKKTRLEITNHTDQDPNPGTKVLLELQFSEQKL